MSEYRKTTTHLLGGFAGGLASAILLQPFDLLKTRLQQEMRSTFWTLMKDINSPIELWRGALPSSIRTSIGSALYLATLNKVRMGMSKGNISNNGSSYLPKLSVFENLISGAITRTFIGFITMPITVIKVRYESTLYSYKSLRDATSHIYASEGVRGFFNGFGATVLRDAPYAGLYMLFYEQFKCFFPHIVPQSLIEVDEKGRFSTYTSSIINGSSAFTAAVMATIITGPFDTVKTRMQLNPKKFNQFSNTIVYIIRNESIRNLFDGISLRLTRKAFSAGIAWGIYEELIKNFV